VLLAAVVGNALLQAALVVPFVTPSFSVWFVVLFFASFVVLVAALAVVVAALRVAAPGVGRGWPRWSEWVASGVVVVAVALASLVSTWLSPVAVLVAIIVLAGVAAGRGAAGFTAFRHHPVRATLLTLLTLVALVLVGPPGLGTLLAGFFITGWPGALVSWLGFGTAGVLLLTAWTALTARSRAR
jgi:hypothetical protein